MFILDFFRKNKVCQHDKVRPDEEISYCPDCGELIENQWYITRCSCCGVKIKATIRNGEVVSQEKFCHNCGAKNFLVEKVPKINFIDIQYAVLVKSILKVPADEVIQSWVDAKTSNCRPQLLPQFL